MSDEFRIAAVAYRALKERYCALEKELAAAIASFNEERERAIAAIAQRDRAKKDALEEAAKVCDRLRNKNYSSEDERWVAGTDDCAVAIREMKKGAGNE